MVNPQAEAQKANGNAEFKKQNFSKAIEYYTAAIEIDGEQHTYWSNRSACYAGLNDWANSASDAENCIRVNKAFIKGYYRLALAQKNQQMYDAASQTILSGLAKDSSNNDLKKLQKEVNEFMRVEKVEALIKIAKEQESNGDFGGALKTIDNALKLDAGNSTCVELRDRIQPRFDAEERKRKAGLSQEEIFKEEGDVKYKNAEFENAIESYTKCLDAISSKGSIYSSELAVKALSNRAACYKQVSNFEGLKSDTSTVLEIDPDNVKALLRRAQAYEACENYKLAMQDTKHLLSLGIDKIGMSSFQMANGLQHRLHRVIEKLKSENY